MGFKLDDFNFCMLLIFIASLYFQISALSGKLDITLLSHTNQSMRDLFSISPDSKEYDKNELYF
jgi:hypothetical protein